MQLLDATYFLIVVEHAADQCAQHLAFPAAGDALLLFAAAEYEWRRFHPGDAEEQWFIYKLIEVGRLQ